MKKSLFLALVFISIFIIIVKNSNAYIPTESTTKSPTTTTKTTTTTTKSPTTTTTTTKSPTTTTTTTKSPTTTTTTTTTTTKSPTTTTTTTTTTTKSPTKTTTTTTTQPITNSCPSGKSLCTLGGQTYCADLNNDRKNCGVCGNECEGPIDGGYCCSNGRCVDNTGTICGYQPTISTTKTTTILTTISTTIHQTQPLNQPSSAINNTTVEAYKEDNVKIKLIGDYDGGFEYTTLFINGKQNRVLCKNCTVSCKTEKPKEVESFYLDIEKYCGEEEGSGFIDFYFKDNSQVDECFSTYEVCINLTNKEYCCRKECNEEGCMPSIAFDCDSFDCIDLKDLIIKDIKCSSSWEKVKCNIQVKRNIINSDLTVSLILYNEDNGNIYYMSKGTINSKSTGLKTFYLKKINDCNNRNVKLAINIFKGNELIYKNEVSFSC